MQQPNEVESETLHRPNGSEQEVHMRGGGGSLHCIYWFNHIIVSAYYSCDVFCCCNIESVPIAGRIKDLLSYLVLNIHYIIYNIKQE